MTPPPKHIRHERTLPILEAPSFSFLLSQPLLTDIRGMIPMIHVANPAILCFIYDKVNVNVNFQKMLKSFMVLTRMINIKNVKH